MLFRCTHCEMGAYFVRWIMAREFAEAFYKSAAWINCKAAYREHVHGLCERCGRPGRIVHHKIKLTPENITNPDITLNFDNLEYLCLRCHNIEHDDWNRISIKWSGVTEGFTFDENGDFVPAGTPPIKAPRG